MDAHESSEEDFVLVPRPKQQNDTQRWLRPARCRRQLHDLAAEQRALSRRSPVRRQRDFGVVTRGRENDDTQRWLIDVV